ncbi:MAG: SEC-C domain-containing protein [Candidatus Nitrosocosmicus sp.]|nr:SEC-C domain-containing protein [Candidatus Nitrosocosmicus sp.]MDN5866720.1 SEC-C domain-containing protein [Candidatus Nitrosocosmicus sp.]
MNVDDGHVDYLLNRLVHSGLEINEKLAQDFLALKDQVIDPLIQIVKNENYWHSSNDQERIAPITALHILSLIKDKSSFDAIVYALCNYDDELDDLVMMLPYLLANFGIAYYEDLAELLLDFKVKYWIKEYIAIALVIISKSYISKDDGDDSRVYYTQGTMELLKKIITTKETDRKSKSLLTRVLADLKDPSSQDFIKSLFENHEIDKKILKYSEVLDIYKGKHDKFNKVLYHKHSPLDYFKAGEIASFAEDDDDTTVESNSQESYTFLDIEENNPDPDFNLVNTSSNTTNITTSTHSDTNNVTLPSFRDKRTDSKDENKDFLIDDDNRTVPQQTLARSKTGRNEPCPCGSGKKYKKCCMNKIMNFSNIDNPDNN